ncbi:MAG TPA: hypothetical protein VL524_17980 [Gemmatimonadaceae bacterium]|jgi:hypothetical protein|nr:hypothetical protein [Gemmatimonadaceae bacterium]
MKRRWLAAASALAIAVAVTSCSGDATGPSAKDCTESTTSVNATISVGDSVVFDWTPKCAIALLVVETAVGHDQWWVAGFNPDTVDIPSTDANRISPRVTYGHVPATSTDSFGPESLVAGTTYVVALWRVLPNGSTLQCQQNHGTACLVAVASFTR